MRVNLIQICKTTDPRVNDYLLYNKRQGLDIITENGFHYTYQVTYPYYRSTEFTSGYDGLWIFDDQKAYRVN